ncbi:MAG: hypothetical protein M3R25_05185 [Bacteroidota bacterium]|nr:hypothetical protein [Bacteroidota bacterium]
MRIWILFFICVISTTSLLSQTSGPVVLTILPHVPTATGYSAKFFFIDDPTKCDPQRGYVPVADQVKHFKESIAALKLNPDDFNKINKFSEPPYINQTYLFSSTKEENVEKIIELARQMNIPADEITSVYPERTFESEDAFALQALRNAKTKAQIIAKYLKLKVRQVTNIVDVTITQSIYDDDDELKKYLANPEFMELIRMLESYDSGSASTYALRVTFLLEK